MKLGYVVAVLVLATFGCEQAPVAVDGAAISDATVVTDSGDGEPIDASRADATPPDAATVDAARDDTGVGGADAGSTDSGISPSGLRGVVLFFEGFEDTNFAARGWYDSSGGALSTEHAPTGSTRSLECRFRVGAVQCEGGTPARHGFAATEAVYMSYHVRFSPGWVGSGRPYQPHEFLMLTDVDGDWSGPAASQLTTYVEHVGGFARLAIQDATNVDLACVLRNDGSFVGCGGSFGTYPFTEMRSVSACNGHIGDGTPDCFPNGGGTWYSSMTWSSSTRVLSDTPGPSYESDWHFIEAYFRLNSIVAGVGIPDGTLIYRIDGVEQIRSDAVLFRTAAHPTMRFDQLLLLPYIGDGSPIDQSIFYDDLTVAVGL